jgi:hypothetical protein
MITIKRQGWLFNPEGAQRPALRILLISSLLIGLSLNSRTLRRLSMVSMTLFSPDAGMISLLIEFPIPDL